MNIGYKLRQQILSDFWIRRLKMKWLHGRKGKMNAVRLENKTILVTGECEIIRGCHNRDKGTAENERLRNPKFIFSYPKNERLIFWVAAMPSRKKSRPWGWGDSQRTGVRAYPLFVLAETTKELSVWELDVVTRKGECEIIWATREKPDFMRVYAAWPFHLNLFLPVMVRCGQRDFGC